MDLIDVLFPTAACHVCPFCGGAGTRWDRAIRARVTCERCGGSGSGLAR